MTFDPSKIKPRRRAPLNINPPKRLPPAAQEPDKSDSDVITVRDFRHRVPNHRPFGPGQTSHATCDPRPNDVPDPRMFPLLIVMPHLWRNIISPSLKYRMDEIRKWTQDTDFDKAWRPGVFPGFITEYALRKHCRKKWMDDGMFAALQTHCEKKRETWIDDHRGMFVVKDGKIVDIDFTKNSGPFYLETTLEIEHHYGQKLQPVAK